ncbi:MAG: nucleotidyltransferase domain-containing protein [Candidatus Aenigmarchaeota archaeon]|nr:nucleotidyltransferase domain-containing protein [Candidatus Aenigmarchaeota archaeon]
MLHMEQKDYSMEVVAELLRGPCHVRGLAQRLSTNHMMVYRVVKRLLRENAVDYRKSGRNTAYFLKNTTEARVYALMCESYKLLMMVSRYPAIRPVVDGLRADRRIKMAVIFGSYAKSLARPDSDIDLFVDAKDARLKQELGRLDSRLNVKVGSYDKNNLLIREMEKNHVIIKGIEEFYERSGLLG